MFHGLMNNPVYNEYLSHMLGKEEVDRSGAVQQEWWVNGMQDAL
jgi:hypothetical protein